MTTIGFDSHEAVKNFKQVGFTEMQAEALTYVMRDAIHGNSISKSACKAELGAVVGILKDELDAFERRFTLRIAAMMLIWATAIALF